MSAKFIKFQPIARQQNERILLLGAAGLAISILLVITVVLNYRTEARAKENIPLPPVSAVPAVIGTVTLLAPSRDIAPGTKLTMADLKEVYWPRNQVPQDAIHDISEAQNLFSKQKLSAGMPVLRTNLSSEPALTPLSLTKGFRAVSIEVDAVSGIEGHALPGTRVDVVLTYMRKDDALTSKVLVQNARVLSYGGDDKPIAERAFMQNARRSMQSESTITLETTPQDALKIETAKQLGHLSLFMRAGDDNQGQEIVELNARDIDQGYRKHIVTGANCSKGRVKSAGKEYLVDCEGGLSQIDNSIEP